MYALSCGLVGFISVKSTSVCSSAHRSNDEGWKGASSTSLTVRAARWLVVSRPPVSMTMSWYLSARRRTSFRTAMPARVMQLNPARRPVLLLRWRVKSEEVV